ncbi:SDR family oxidoreductase [Pseudoalteromonas sp. A22]|uniref:SDR family oxidoreductase n=1 Tax=Pseudoalteromonas sp. A22 TaxID=327511 RepID=UPI001BA77234|nr:SDR family oxidoreductase [Pseudoalteromonas sp. A22]QUI61450.1 SDR family oxidoreductase [Pseudoalteromonas sp. A22]
MKGKKILIVGGSTGIGLALAKRVSEDGGEVLIASRSAFDKQASIRSQPYLESCTCYSVDITVESEIKNLLEKIGKIDHLIFTVKSPLIVSPFLELDLKEVRHAFDTKFWGQYSFAKLAHQYINDGGSIVFSSGTLGKRPYNGYSTLSTISGAVESLGKALAIELAPIRVNTVSPGFKTLKELEEKIPLGLGSDSQISNSYLFLMNDSYITGSTIVSDGGAMLV